MSKEIEVSVRSLATGALLVIGTLYGLAGITSVELHEGGFQQSTMGATAGETTELRSGSYSWVEPISNNVFIYNTRNKQYTENLASIERGISTADGQPLSVDLSLDIGLDRAKLGKLHAKYGEDWYEEAIYPRARGQLRFATGSVNSDKTYKVSGKIAIAAYLDKQFEEFKEYGIIVRTNLRRVDFTNADFIATLEEKASATERVIIAERNAEAAVQDAIRVENKAEGNKQKVIKEAEADAQKEKLRGEGLRDSKIAEAVGIEAVGRANAVTIKLAREAIGSGDNYAKIKVAEALGDNFQIWGIPTGAPGTSSIVGLDSIVGKALGVSR